jgi:hypothetical protein
MGDSQLSMWYSLSKVDCLSGVKQTSHRIPCASSDKLIDFSWLSLGVLFQPHGRCCQCQMPRDLPVKRSGGPLIPSVQILTLLRRSCNWSMLEGQR